MSDDFLNEKINLSAYVTKDDRGTGLLSLFVTMHRPGGYSKYGRVNTVGGFTYVMTRDGNVAPSAPTLLINEDEAQILLTSLGSYLHGPNWRASAAELHSMADNLKLIAEENRNMRIGKKAIEKEMRAAEKELRHLRGVAVRYDKTMTLFRAIASGFLVPGLIPADDEAALNADGCHD